MLKPIGYFIAGIFAGLTISLLMKDAKPVNRIDLYDSYRIRYEHPPRYPYGYDYYYRPLEYRSVIRTQSNTGNDEVVQSSGGSKDTERGETHTNVRQVNDKVKRN
jgi:hypothetical protein